MNIGIDIDGTITAAPEFFACLTKALFADGHNVHILTFRAHSMKEQTEKLLKDIGIKYHGLHFVENFVDLSLKARWADKLDLDMVMEDRINVLGAMPSNVQKFWLIPKDGQK